MEYLIQNYICVVFFQILSDCCLHVPYDYEYMYMHIINVHLYEPDNRCEHPVRITKLFTQEWHDDFLAWNESNYDDLIHFVVPATTVWLPDIGFKNRCLIVCFIPYPVAAPELPTNLSFPLTYCIFDRTFSQLFLLMNNNHLAPPRLPFISVKNSF